MSEPGAPLSSGSPSAAGDGLVELITRLSLARGLDEIMAVVRQGARRLTGADGVTFVLREGDTCFYADEDAVSPLWKGQRFPMETCISGYAMRHREPVVIEDVYRDRRVPLDAYRLTFVRSMVMVPVRQEDPVAAIGAYWARRHKAGPDEVRLLTAIANGAAVAMSNVALIASLERAKAEAEEASARRLSFFAAANHDLRQPLQAIRLFHDLLDGALTDPGQRRVLAMLNRATATADELLAGLLDSVRLEGGFELRLGRAALSELAGEVADELGPVAAAKGLRLRIRVPRGLSLVTDRALLKRAVTNLVANAIRYTEAGGVLLAVRRRGGGVVIEVWDTGVGIAPEFQELVFKEFYRVEPAEGCAGGLGLGLAIVSRVCQLLGCAVAVRSRPGRGSVFRISVPAEP